MITYTHVEDYLEYLAGYDVGSAALIFPTHAGRISLARYDIQIVDSMSSNTIFGTALTDRQAELAVKLILKYRRQFNNNGVDIGPIETTPVFRYPPRKIDRSKSIWISDDKIKVKFPYDADLIKQVQEFKVSSEGMAQYHRDDKIWSLGLTEYNINWVVTWGKTHEFEIDQYVQELFARVLACETVPYNIELVRDGEGFKITNASDSLIEFINTHGGFGIDNLTNLIDYSGVCGYDAVACALEYGSPTLTVFGTIHTTYLEPSDENLNYIFDYAKETGRYPICIYNPTLVDIDLSRFDEQDIVRFDRNGKTKTVDYDPYDIKVVYAQKIPTTWEFPVPLLVSTFEMMFGGRKMDWTQRAEKIVYLTASKLRDPT